MADYEVKGGVVRDLRNRKLWTQKRLSKAAGVSKQTITRMETGSNVAQFDTIEKVATALEVEPSVLIQYRTDSRVSDENVEKLGDAQREWEVNSEEDPEGDGPDDPDGRGT